MDTFIRDFDALFVMQGMSAKLKREMLDLLKKQQTKETWIAKTEVWKTVYKQQEVW